jgi:hypothetical protein
MIALHQRPSVHRDLIRSETAALLQTPLLRKRPIRTKAQLYAFMETHVFAVWDFMCLTKALQHAIAPSNPIWFPPANCRSARLINEIIVSEESDVSLDGASYKSHFEIYIDAMDEVGANTAPVRAFLELVRREGVDLALARATMPEAARRFVTTTMSFVHSGKPWVIGAAFTYGREDVIPDMFRGLIENGVVDDETCPVFRYYLQRHIDVDGGTEARDGHGKMAEEMLDYLCGSQADKVVEATEAALRALVARRKLWEEVFASITKPSLVPA